MASESTEVPDSMGPVVSAESGVEGTVVDVSAIVVGVEPVGDRVVVAGEAVFGARVDVGVDGADGAGARVVEGVDGVGARVVVVDDGEDLLGTRVVEGVDGANGGVGA